MGLHHDAFATPTVRDPETILRSQIPKRKFAELKQPIFREPGRLKRGLLPLVTTIMLVRANTQLFLMICLPPSAVCFRVSCTQAILDIYSWRNGMVYLYRNVQHYLTVFLVLLPC